MVAQRRKDVLNKIEAHERPIEEHLEKARQYSDPKDKAFAMKTVERLRQEIAGLRRKLP